MENRNMNAALTLCAIAFGVQTTWAEPKGADGKDMGMQKRHGIMGKMSTEQMIQNWPAKPKEAAIMMIQKYGAPQEVTEERLIWNNNGPWKRTILTRQETKHDFPMPHMDFMEQVINYRVPPEMFDDLAAFDGSVMAERTTGELSARCDKEENNILGLNLANDVITGKRTAMEAHKEFTNVAAKSMASKEKPAYMQKLQFEVKSGSMADPDKVTLTPTQMAQAPE